MLFSLLVSHRPDYPPTPILIRAPITNHLPLPCSLPSKHSTETRLVCLLTWHPYHTQPGVCTWRRDSGTLRDTTRRRPRIHQVWHGAPRTSEGPGCAVPGAPGSPISAQARTQGRRRGDVTAPPTPGPAPTSACGRLPPGLLPDQAAWSRLEPRPTGGPPAVPPSRSQRRGPGGSPGPPEPAAPPASAVATGPAPGYPLRPQPRVRPASHHRLRPGPCPRRASTPSSPTCPRGANERRGRGVNTAAGRSSGEESLLGIRGCLARSLFRKEGWRVAPLITELAVGLREPTLLGSRHASTTDLRSIFPY